METASPQKPKNLRGFSASWSGKRVSDDGLCEYIKNYLDSNHFAPSVRNVADFLGNSLSGAHSRLQSLKRKGRVDWNENETRTLRVID